MALITSIMIRNIPLRIQYLAAPPATKSKELYHYQNSLISALLSAEGIPSSEDRSKACLHPTTSCSGDGDEREGSCLFPHISHLWVIALGLEWKLASEDTKTFINSLPNNDAPQYLEESQHLNKDTID